MTGTTDLIQRLRGALADIAGSKDMTLSLARKKARRVYGETEKAADAIEQQAAELGALKRDIESLLPDLTAVNVQIEALRADAERLDWLARRLFSADFAYGDPPICAIVFEWPATASVGADLRASIDAALRQEQPNHFPEAGKKVAQEGPKPCARQ